MTHSIQVKDLTLNFGAVSVLKTLNLDVAEGEFIVLLGPSGCGKSTLLNCLAGLLDITDGQIFIKGKNVTWAEPSDRGIGMVFQSYALYPQMTVRGNLSFGLKNARLPQDEIDKRVARAAEILQIGPCWTASRGRFRVASGSVLPLAARWCAMWTCSCLTNLCRTLMPSCALNCVWKSSGCTAG